MKGLAKTSASQWPHLEGVSGPHRGQILELTSDRVTIGRHDNNDLVLSGDGVSRYHAMLEVGKNGQWTISDTQSKNGLVINGGVTRSHLLQNGDTIQIGVYTFRFHAGSDGEVALAEAPGEPVYPQMVPGASSPKSAQPRNLKPFIYGAILVLGLYYFFSSSSTPETKPAEGGTETTATGPGEAPRKDFTSTGKQLPGLEDPALTKAEKETQGIDFQNNALREAEQYFKKGQREYLNKNYHRAIDDFRTALNLNRAHELADYYMRLSVFEVESEAKQNMEIGRKYFESMQYARAIYHFQQVITLMTHRPGDKMSVDANKYIEQCQKRLQAAEQFP